MKSKLTETLPDLLQQVQRPGSFYSTGTIDIHPPRLEVEDVGPIALPLLPVQAKQIVAVAEAAPYGRGTETLHDADVRRTWQIDAARVRISGRRWAEDLSNVVDRVTADLSVTGRVEAELYKLLVYDTGSFFVTHRDTEKAPGMFATLVIVLPCDYSGGELLVRHKGHEARLDLRRDEPSEAAFAAFYADCRHEVLPIASGHRLALIYNLVRVDRGDLPRPPDYASEQTQVVKLLRDWSEAGRTSDTRQNPLKLIYPLEHAYSQADLGFDALKGADTAVAGLLSSAADSAACDLHLALVTVEESGWAEYAGGGYRGDDEYEIGEVCESSETIHDWRHPDGSRPEMGALPFYGDEVSPPGAFDDLEDVEPDFEEATGNEGVSFERLYQRAALVIWPHTNRPAVLAEGGLTVSIPFLQRLVAQWESAGGQRDDPIWQEARDLAACIRDAWPKTAWERKQASESGRPGILLACLSHLGDLDGAADFLTQQAAAGAYGPTDNDPLAAVLKQLPPERAADLLIPVVANNLALQPGACANLLTHVTKDGTLNAEQLGPVALTLVTGLPVEPDTSLPFGSSRPEPPKSELVADTLIALERIDPTLAAQALKHFLSLPSVYPMDRMLLPAALSLRDAGEDPEPVSIKDLRHAVLQHLQQRIDEPLEPPADWRRDAEIACNCPHCRQLSGFLASPEQSVWRFKAAEAKRSHVSHSISRHHCDLDLATDKQRRPYTLVCTKNMASHLRRVNQRKQDLEHRARLADR